MQTFSPLTVASLLAVALASAHATDHPSTAAPHHAAVTPLPVTASGPASAPSSGTDASVTGPLPRPAQTAPAAPASLVGPADAAAWRCGARAIATGLDPATDAVQPRVGGRTLTLLSRQAASGRSLSTEQGDAFRQHAGEASLSLAGGATVKCVHEAATTIG